MLDDEQRREEVEIGGRELLMLLVIVSNFGDERGLVRRGHSTPFIKQVEYAQVVVVYQLKHLDVVFEFDLLELLSEPFHCKVFFLNFEYFSEVDLVQPFIGVVDEELLQAVELEDFKPIDV